MEDVAISVVCGQCRTALTENPDATPETREPCAQCGSTARSLEVAVGAKVSTHAGIKGKGRQLQTGRPAFEFVTREDYWRKTGEWRWYEVFIDRVRNIYRKVVRDRKTGQELYRCEESLREHTGHGRTKLPGRRKK